MSITDEMAQKHKNDPAILCCRTEVGTILKASYLEDPVIFPDLEESGLLTIPKDVLTIGQVLGGRLLATVESLVPLTPALVENFSMPEKDSLSQEENLQVKAASPISPKGIANSSGSSKQVKIHIAKGENITLEIPFVMPVGRQGENEPVTTISSSPSGTATQKTETEAEPRKIHSVRHDHYLVKEVVFGEETKLEGTTLTLRQIPENLCNDLPDTMQLVEKIEVNIITPQQYGQYSDTIMDVQPIATKEAGEVGEGVTRVLDGVIFLVTGIDHNGVQVGEFGSCEGELNRNIMWGRPGAPDEGEIFIKTKVTIKAHANMERPGPLAVHRASDYVCEEIRRALQKVDNKLCIRSEEITHYRRPGKPKVLIVKEIMGQGAMHDNLLLPVEPVGTLGAKANVDLGNLPIMFSPTEIRDGGIHALTCIGPASKETSRHYWREPLVKLAMEDDEIDLVGVMLIGSPQANTDKFYVSKRLGMAIETMDIAGAIVTTEGFGNNHVDFASHIEQIGQRGIKVVGVSYSAVQGALVVGNQYMNAMCDNNKSAQGIENEILANNTLCPEDAIRQLAMLKTLIGGGAIKPAERKWSNTVKLNNLKIIEDKLNEKIATVANEQILPKSKKRQEIYEVEA